MKSRIMVAAVGVPLLLLVMLWAPIWVMAVMIAGLCLNACDELMKCVGAEMEMPLRLISGVGALAIVFHEFLIFQDQMDFRWSEVSLPLALAMVVIAAFAYAVLRGGEVKFVQVCAALFAMFAFSYSFSAFLRLYRYGYHRAFLLLPLIFSFCSDTFAFFTGLAIGKHKLAPKVSPNKTIEGAVGGLVGSVVGSVVFALVMNTWYGQSLRLPMFALMGLGGSVVAQLGDLSFSLIKREFGIKDYGDLFKAHGGVLDRFDSVLFVAPVLTLVLPSLL